MIYRIIMHGACNTVSFITTRVEDSYAVSESDIGHIPITIELKHAT
jgi:hypothetical protein